MATGDGSVKVRILNEGLEAGIIVTDATTDEGIQPTYDMAMVEIRKNGVVNGLDEIVLRSIFNDSSYDQEIIFARGLAAKPGKDGEIKFFFSLKKDLKPETDEKGNADFRNINILVNVSKGDRLVEVTPPLPGVLGKDVQGKKIVPKSGKMYKLPIGLNTEISADNENILIASKDGNVNMLEGRVNVDDVFEVAKDVDFSTGNIDYIGSLMIKGGVKAGFEVKAGGDIEIGGIVEDAKVIAGGNVIVKGGFIGKNEGLIKAGGDVILKFCTNQNIEAEGKIIIGEAVMHSKLISNDEIEVAGRKGMIVGGYTSARNKVTASQLGNYQEVATEVVVGVNEELEKKLKDIINEIVKNEANYDNILKALKVLERKKKILQSLPPDQDAMLKKLNILSKSLPDQKNLYEAQRENLIEEINQFASESEIDVALKIYKGVMVRIMDKRKVINSELNRTTFKLIDAEVQQT